MLGAAILSLTCAVNVIAEDPPKDTVDGTVADVNLADGKGMFTLVPPKSEMKMPFFVSKDITSVSRDGRPSDIYDIRVEDLAHVIYVKPEEPFYVATSVELTSTVHPTK